MAQLRQGLEGWRATEAPISWSYYLGSLADAYARGVHAGEGLAVMSEALTCVDQTGERYAEAELHRLKGELLLKQAVPHAYPAEVFFSRPWTLLAASRPRLGSYGLP
jgi:predicted ATPase